MRINYVQRIEAPRSQVTTTSNLVEYYQNRNADSRKKFAEEISQLNSLIPLDYMGSAEFEFGSVGDCLEKISRNRNNFVFFDFNMTGSPESRFPQTKKKLTAEKTVTVFGFCLEEHKFLIQDFFKLECIGSYMSHYKGGKDLVVSLKESSYIREGLFGKICRVWNSQKRIELLDSKIFGWLDIENLWFVSTIRSQRNDLARLLGVPHQSQESSVPAEVKAYLEPQT